MVVSACTCRINPAIKIPEPTQKLRPIQGWAFAALCRNASALLNPFSRLQAMAKTTKATGKILSEGSHKGTKDKGSVRVMN